MSNIILKDVSYKYKNSDRYAVSNVSCTFSAGKVNAVVGPSGSGKTTLLSIIAGLDKVHSGSAYIDDKDLSSLDLDLYRRKYVSMIFQAFHLFPLLTVVENVCYPQELEGVNFKEAKEKSKKLLEMVGISSEKHKRYPTNLSGGEQQRVAIARALSTGAKVILADEPTGNLDGENSKLVMSILTNLAHEQGYCVIIVTHDNEIAESADMVFKMADGVMIV